MSLGKHILVTEIFSHDSKKIVAAKLITVRKVRELPVRELVALNLANTGNHLDLNRMDFELEA